jgi:ribosomal protein L11 methyltransferase
MKYIKLQLETQNTKPFEETLEESVTSILVNGMQGFKVEHNNILDLHFSRWEITVIPMAGTVEELKEFIIEICSNLKIKILSLEVLEDNKDYLTLEEHRYSIDIGIFVIFNNEEDYVKFYSPSKIPILIKQSTGFGTGKHETTSMCLESISKFYNEKYSFNNMLDLGTGSAILAIAMEKLFKGDILATDIDELALNAGNEFILKNNSAQRVKTLVSIGFEKISPQEFDLITANILLNPLLDMVDDFYRYLITGGFLVLSGFLDTQANKLIETFTHKGFKLIEIKEKDIWRSVIFIK